MVVLMLINVARMMIRAVVWFVVNIMTIVGVVTGHVTACSCCSLLSREWAEACMMRARSDCCSSRGCRSLILASRPWKGVRISCHTLESS